MLIWDKYENKYRTVIAVEDIEQKFDMYINSLMENLDEDRRWCDIELVENFESLKKEILKETEEK